jgi:hypothetical protein
MSAKTGRPHMAARAASTAILRENRQRNGGSERKAYFMVRASSPEPVALRLGKRISLTSQFNSRSGAIGRNAENK